MAKVNEYYKVLGLSPDADKAAIKKAYRRLALKYHPDRDPSSKQKFLDILEAYEVLMGIRKRKEPKAVYSAREIEHIYNTLQQIANEKKRQRLKKLAAQKRNQRALEQAKEYKKALITLGGVLIIAISSYAAYNWYFNLMLNRDKQTAVAIVIGLETKRVIYQFKTANGELLKNKEYVRSCGLEMLAETGLPLRVGHRFKLNYSTKNPSYQKINYQLASAETLRNYVNMCIPKVYEIYKKSWQKYTLEQRKVRAQCLLYLIYQKMGLRGLAHIYHYNENPLENIYQNKITWHFFRSKDGFKEIQTLCKSPL
jgi:hypothetical protein